MQNQFKEKGKERERERERESGRSWAISQEAIFYWNLYCVVVVGSRRMLLYLPNSFVSDDSYPRNCDPLSHVSCLSFYYQAVLSSQDFFTIVRKIRFSFYYYFYFNPWTHLYAYSVFTSRPFFILSIAGFLALIILRIKILKSYLKKVY